MIRPQPWGKAFTLTIPVIKRAAVDFAASANWTPAAGDVKVQQDDDGTFDNVGTLPTSVGTSWKFSLSAAEMQATDHVTVQVVDSATKAVEDQEFTIPIDYGIRSSTAQAGAAGTITLDASASSVDNFYQWAFVWITSGTGAGQCRLISGYVGDTKVASVTPNWATNPDNTSVFKVDWQAGVNAVALGGTTQTGRDIGASVLLSSGTGAGQVNLSSGKVPATLDWSGDVTNKPTIGTANAGDEMAITSAARSALVAAIEVELANESTGQALMQAIADKLAEEFDIENLTITAIATACRDAILNRVLSGNHDTNGTAGKLLQNSDVATSSRSNHSADDVQTALEANGSKLDHLWETTEDNAGTRRFTAAALAQAPTGTSGGGDATAENQATIIGHLTDIKGTGFDGTTDGLPALHDQVAALSVSSGSGAYTITVTVKVGTTPVEGARVRFSKAGSVDSFGTTNASGVVPIHVNSGTWSVAITADAATFAGATLVVSASAAVPYTMTPRTITPSSAGNVTGYMTCFGSDGLPEEGVEHTLKQVTVAAATGGSYDPATRTVESDDSGYVEFTNLFPGAEYVLSGGELSNVRVVVPTGVTEFALTSLLRE